MKVSFIATVFNEEKTIDSFLKSIFSQSKIPDEVIIVDGGSSDRTVAKIKDQRSKIKDYKGRFLILSKKGNRSVGRNEAIRNASNEIIACSDAGCELDTNWVKNIIKPFENSKIDVVAGYYRGKSDTIFQKCLVPYVLVMSDRVNENEFLPATRSMAFKKFIWKKAGGFDEKYSHNEDYVFAHKLKEIGAHIVFERKAIVNWIPLKNVGDTFRMFFRFAFGDSESGILREKVLLLFGRYILFFYLVLLTIIERSVAPLYVIALGLFVYVTWSIKKNYKYVQDAKAIIFLPLLQFTSDLAVITGTSIGFLKRINFKRILRVIVNNKGVSVVIGLYTLLMFLLINWGIPNLNHPFNYFMDEWHQAQAVRAVFTQGSPNVPGSANGSMFHFLISGLLLIPFIFTGIVNPFAIKSSIESVELQQRLFQILRLNTLFFGVASIILITYIAKKYFKLNPFLVSLLFVVNPIWIMLSNYFKYDIALIFWILLSFLFLLKYLLKPSFVNYLLGVFFAGIALSVKISALPLLPILIVAFYLSKDNKNIKQLLVGVVSFVGTFLLFGIPDLLLGKGNINEYLYDNLVRTPNYSSNYILGMPYWMYSVSKGIPTVFGTFLSLISFFGLVFMMIIIFKKKFIDPKRRLYIFILICLILFVLSLVPLQIEARGNRLLVLLPFMVLMAGIFINRLINLTKGLLKIIIIFILMLFLLLQTSETFSWINLKLNKDLREIFSVWIGNNIPLRSVIGIENIPIYQSLPDIILKDYYLTDRLISKKAGFNYQVIVDSSVKLPDYVIVTNEDVVKNYLVKSPKKDLISLLKKRDYKKIYHVRQNLSLLSLFRDELDYFMSGLIQAPISISVYQEP